MAICVKSCLIQVFQSRGIGLANLVEGSVARIGESGQLISDITDEQLENTPRDGDTLVRFGGHETQGLFSADHGQPESTMVAYVGEGGSLEIEIVGVSLSDMLGIKAGEKISVSW